MNISAYEMEAYEMDIHEFEVYRSLCIAAYGHADKFNEPTLEALQRIAINRHCGNGFYSIDGMLDDLTMLTGSEEIASEIVNSL
jgi:hypothetical protein